MSKRPAPSTKLPLVTRDSSFVGQPRDNSISATLEAMTDQHGAQSQQTADQHQDDLVVITKDGESLVWTGKPNAASGEEVVESQVMNLTVAAH